MKKDTFKDWMMFACQVRIRGPLVKLEGLTNEVKPQFGDNFSVPFY